MTDMRCVIFDIEVVTYGRGKKSAVISTLSWWYSETSLMSTIVGREELVEFLADATEANILVSFNGNRYDIPIIEQSGFPAGIARSKSFDLWHHFCIAKAGEMSLEEASRLVPDSSLDNLAWATLGKQKLKLNATPSDLWKWGHHDLVIRYNKYDTELTRLLFYHALDYGYLRHTTKGQVVEEVDCGTFVDDVSVITTANIWGW